MEKIFVPLHVGRKVAEAKGYTAMLGHYLLHGQEMDETIALFFRAPHSYTGEDVIELSVHGGTAMADGFGVVDFPQFQGGAGVEEPILVCIQRVELRGFALTQFIVDHTTVQPPRSIRSMDGSSCKSPTSVIRAA